VETEREREREREREIKTAPGLTQQILSKGHHTSCVYSVSFSMLEKI
jgi:hypothetical protein